MTDRPRLQIVLKPEGFNGDPVDLTEGLIRFPEHYINLEFRIDGRVILAMESAKVTVREPGLARLAELLDQANRDLEPWGTFPLPGEPSKRLALWAETIGETDV